MAENSFHQGNRLKYLIEKSTLKQSEILSLTGTAKSSLYDLYKKESIDKMVLEKFCRVMNEDIRQFYPDLISTVSEPGPEYRILREKVKTLEQMLKDKEVIIIRQDEIIEMLKQSKKHKP